MLEGEKCSLRDFMILKANHSVLYSDMYPFLMGYILIVSAVIHYRMWTGITIKKKKTCFTLISCNKTYCKINADQVIS